MSLLKNDINQIIKLGLLLT